MQQRAATRRVLEVSSPFALLSAAALVLLAAPSSLLANQVYKACGPKWARHASKLETEKLTWLSHQRSATVTADLDDDGKPDTVEMTNTPSFRNCDVQKFWDRKEITVRIEYANGKTQVFHWISGQLVDKIFIHRDMGRMLLVGVDARGRTVNKWVEYQEAPPPSDPPAVIAEGPARDGVSGEAPYQISGLSSGEVEAASVPGHE